MNACQTREPGGPGTGVTAVAGVFYITVYGADRLAVVPRPVDREVAVANCDAAQFRVPPEQVGALGFSADGSVTGELPCVSVTVLPTTWGRLKSAPP
jgi:hypothetical protein